MENLYDLEKLGATPGLKFNLKEVIIGDLVLNNVDVIVVKDQDISLVFGKKYFLNWVQSIILTINTLLVI